MGKGIPIELLICDLRAVRAQAGRLTQSLYDRMGRYTSRTIILRFGGWDEARSACQERVSERPSTVHRERSKHEELDEAKAWRQAQRAQRRRRACLRCDQSFLSAGPHNRLCEWCAERAGRYTADFIGSLV